MGSPIKRLIPQRANKVFRQETLFDKQTSEKSYDLILGKGIVLDVDYYGDKEYGRTPYSLKLKLDKRYDDVSLTKYTPPLLPIHTVSLPEVGEEVWVIFPVFKDYSTAFWISRVNYNSEFSNNALNNFDYSLNNVCVCGGAKTYELFMPLITEIYVTILLDEYDGDSYLIPFEYLFPNSAILKETSTYWIVKYWK